MAQCPHCKKKTISSWKAHNTQPWNTLTCPSCKGKSKPPWWPKAYLIAIVVAYLIVQSVVGYAESYIVGILSAVSLMVGSAWKFALVPCDKNGVTQVEQHFVLKSISIFLAVLFAGHGVKVAHDVSVRDLSDYIGHHYADYNEPHIVWAMDAVMAIRYPISQLDPEQVVGYEERTVLTYAAYEENIPFLTELLKYTKNIDHRDPQGDTALLVALNIENQDVAEILIESGANVNTVFEDRNGEPYYLIEHFNSGWQASSSLPQFDFILKNGFDLENKAQLEQTLKSSSDLHRSMLIDYVMDQWKSNSELSSAQGELLSFLRVLKKEEAYFNKDRAIEAFIEKDSYQIYKIASELEEESAIDSAIYFYSLAHELGNARATLALGYLYGTKKGDISQSIRLNEEAFNRGVKKAALSLGNLYEKRLIDYEKAISWYKKAYQAEQLNAAYLLGELYANVLKDKPKAKRWYMKLAKKGFGKAIDKVVELYPKSINSPDDVRLYHYPEIKKIEGQAKSDSKAAKKLAETYYESIEDFPRAIYWFEQAIKLGGEKVEPLCASSLANSYYQTKAFEKSLHWYKRSLSFNYPESYNIAMVYQALNDNENAITWFKKSLELDDYSMAAVKLGDIYADELKDAKLAEQWYLKAVKEGSSKGAERLAFYYRKTDITKAAAYLIGFINHGFTKGEIVDNLFYKWGMDMPSIRKALALHRTIDLPFYYSGDI